MNTYNIVAKHTLLTSKRGAVMNTVHSLVDANKAVHKLQTQLGTEWKVNYRIVRH